MIKMARENECPPTSNSTSNIEVTHSQYTDDTLIFCDADERQLLILRSILVLFEGVSGLHINWRESQLYPINEVYNIVDLSRILGGEIGFLGMPLGAKSKALNIWNPFFYEVTFVLIPTEPYRL